MLSRKMVVTASLGFAVVAVGAAAAPTPLAPRDGAVVRTSFPVLRWSLPPSEDSEAIHLARLPDVQPEGNFVPDNVLESSALAARDTRWSPALPLWAGSYWWQVESLDRLTFAPHFSAARRFTIPIALRVVRIAPAVSSATVTVHWRGNTARASVTLRMFSGETLLWSRTKGVALRVPNALVATAFTVPTRYRRSLRSATFRVAIAARVPSGR